MQSSDSPLLLEPASKKSPDSEIKVQMVPVSATPLSQDKFRVDSNLLFFDLERFIKKRLDYSGELVHS